MRSIFGTNAECRFSDERARGEKMLHDAEDKIDRLNDELDQRAGNLDQVLEQMSERRNARQ